MLAEMSYLPDSTNIFLNVKCSVYIIKHKHKFGSHPTISTQKAVISDNVKRAVTSHDPAVGVADRCCHHGNVVVTASSFNIIT